jgi:hypothetical protein
MREVSCADGRGVGAHVNAVGEQCHRTGKPADSDLDDHRHEREANHQEHPRAGGGGACRSKQIAIGHGIA